MALTAKKVYAILKRQISDMEAKLNSPVRYRGTVATADLLPLNPDIGDMYNIESKSVYGEAGMNVAWNGVVWDTMGAPIDMSLYLTKEEAETVIQRLVTEYFEKNPVKPGATTEQAQQIEQNKADVASLKEETGSLKEDLSNKITKFYASNQGETHITDSDNGKIMDMVLYGKSEQKSTMGKNLLKLSKLNVYEGTNGLLTTMNADGSVSVTGTPTYNWSNITKIDNKCHTDNATYTFSVDKNSGIIIGLKLGRTKLDDANYQTHRIMQNQLSCTFETGASNEYCSLFLEGLTVGKSYNFTIYPMLELGTEATAYEPYTGGQPSPSPDYPQEIKSVVNPTIKLSNGDGTESQTVTLPYVLNAIPVNSGGNVTINGQQYIADYVDVERRKLVKMVDSSKLDNAQSIIDKTEWLLAEPQETDLATGEITAFKALATYYPATNISVNSEQLGGYTVFNYPISMQNGWNYVKQQIGDTREYIYDMYARTQDTDLQAAEAYVNSEYAVALTELEV